MDEQNKTGSPQPASMTKPMAVQLIEGHGKKFQMSAPVRFMQMDFPCDINWPTGGMSVASGDWIGIDAHGDILVLSSDQLARDYKPYRDRGRPRKENAK